MPKIHKNPRAKEIGDKLIELAAFLEPEDKNRLIETLPFSRAKTYYMLSGRVLNVNDAVKVLEQLTIIANEKQAAIDALLKKADEVKPVEAN